MINCSVALGHPSLKVAPAILSQIGEQQKTPVLLFDPPQAPADLGPMLEDCANYNHDSKAIFTAASERYQAQKQQTSNAVSGPVLSVPKNPALEMIAQTKSSRRQDWSNLASRHSQSNLALAQNIAATVNSWIGPCILTQCQLLDGGVHQLQFNRQTTAESIFDPFTNPNVLTGDVFNPKDPERSKLQPALAQPNQEVLFAAQQKSLVLLDGTNGLLALVPPSASTD